MLKRIMALGLAFVLLMSLGACKPDNIQYPTVITDPDTTPESTPEVNTQTTPESNVPTVGEGQTTTDTPTATNPDAPVTNEGATAPDTPVTNEGETTPNAPVAGEGENTVEGNPGQGADTPAVAPNQGTETTPENPNTQPPAQGESVETVTTPDTTPETDKTQDVVPESTVNSNPLYATDFKPATDAKGALSASGFIKNGSTAAALKNRTITFYTADENPAFDYLNEKGVAVNEWQWAEAMAKSFGFQLKYTIKNKSISLKAQRTALFAGRKLSLIQMTDDQLALGMSLSRPATEYLNTAITPFGISGTVLTQSLQTIFAPVGNVNTLWYDSALMPAANDPATLSAQKGWTLEQYKAICQNSVAQTNKPLQMSLHMDWALLSGKSPLTLLEGKLDSNIYARVTQTAFAAIKAVNAQLPALAIDEDVTYSFENGNLAMAYQLAVPTVKEGSKLGYTALPAVQAGEANAVSFGGTFFALPKYQKDEGNDLAALTFAELWCNRYTEARAADLYQIGIIGPGYEAYTNFAETKGQLIFRDPAIDKLCETYFKGLTDPLINTDDAYGAIKDQLMAKIAAYNLYY